MPNLQCRKVCPVVAEDGLVELVRDEESAFVFFVTHPPMAIAQSRIVVNKSYQFNIRAVGEEYQAVFGSIIRMSTAWGECKSRCQPRGRRGEKLVWDEDDDVTSRRSVVSMFPSDERQHFDTKHPAAFEQARLRQESSCELKLDGTYYRSVSMLLLPS
jgi:hypothetical protein